MPVCWCWWSEAFTGGDNHQFGDDSCCLLTSNATSDRHPSSPGMSRKHNRSKNKKAESSEQYLSVLSCCDLAVQAVSLSDWVSIVNSLIIVEISRSSVFLEGTVASESEPATAGKHNTALKALKIDSAAGMLNSSTGLV